MGLVLGHHSWHHQTYAKAKEEFKKKNIQMSANLSTELQLSLRENSSDIKCNITFLFAIVLETFLVSTL